jgi:hypothetical protein
VTSPRASLDELRRAFLAAAEGSVAGGSCPSAGEIWDAAHAQVTPLRAREVVRHVAGCAACTADWRLAMGSADGATVATEPAAARPHPALRWAALGGIAAALAMVGWLGFRDPRSPAEAPVFRASPDAAAIRTLVPEDEPLRRTGALLRWTSAGDGASYTVELSSDDLMPLHTEHGLAATELAVPAEILDRVGAGGTLVWSVEARLPDGSHVRSGAFVHRVE